MKFKRLTLSGIKVFQVNREVAKKQFEDGLIVFLHSEENKGKFKPVPLVKEGNEDFFKMVNNYAKYNCKNNEPIYYSQI